MKSMNKKHYLRMYECCKNDKLEKQKRIKCNIINSEVTIYATHNNNQSRKIAL